MSIDISKLNKIKHTNKGIIAQCPACFETGQDRTGNHLFVAKNGKFGCAVNPGRGGFEHRKRIFALIGVVDSVDKPVDNSKPVDNFSGGSIKPGWLGRFCGKS